MTLYGHGSAKDVVGTSLSSSVEVVALEQCGGEEERYVTGSLWQGLHFRGVARGQPALLA